MRHAKTEFIELTTLDAALEAINNFKRQVADLEEQVASIGEDADRAEDSASKANARAEELEAEMEYFCDDLSRIRQIVKAGRIDDALYEIDKILQAVDPTAKSFTAVAVML